MVMGGNRLVVMIVGVKAVDGAETITAGVEAVVVALAGMHPVMIVDMMTAVVGAVEAAVVASTGTHPVITVDMMTDGVEAVETVVVALRAGIRRTVVANAATTGAMLAPAGCRRTRGPGPGGRTSGGTIQSGRHQP